MNYNYILLHFILRETMIFPHYFLGRMKRERVEVVLYDLT